MKQMRVGFVEGVYSDVIILVHQPRHLHSFYSTPMMAFSLYEENNARIVNEGRFAHCISACSGVGSICRT